jgi:hypothetical protein
MQQYQEQCGNKFDQLGTATVINDLNRGEQISWGGVLTVRREPSGQKSFTFTAAGPVSIQMICDVLAAFLRDYNNIRYFPDYAIGLRRWGERAFDGASLREGIPLVLDIATRLPSENPQAEEVKNPPIPSFEESSTSSAPLRQKTGPADVITEQREQPKLCEQGRGKAPSGVVSGDALRAEGVDTSDRSSLVELQRKLDREKRDLDRRSAEIQLRERLLKERGSHHREQRATPISSAELERARANLSDAEKGVQEQKELLEDQQRRLATREQQVKAIQREVSKRVSDLNWRENVVKTREHVVKTREEAVKIRELAADHQGTAQPSRATESAPIAIPSITPEQLSERETKIREQAASNQSLALRLAVLEKELKNRGDELGRRENAFEEEKGAFEAEWLEKDRQQAEMLADSTRRLEEAKMIEARIAEFLRTKIINPDERT